MTTTIPAITALPAVPNPNTPATFETLGYPFTVAQANMAVEQEAMRVAMNTVGGEVTTLASTATTQATAAAAANAAAALNAAAAAASAGAALWVTGTNYTAGVVRYSPTDYQTYRDTVGGVSSTDPASDTTGRWISAMLPSVEAVGLPAMPPTAVFNFASGVIDSRFIEARTTLGTYYNKFGRLKTLAAGVAKTTYNPETKEAKGYLSEPAVTYIAARSAEMDNASYWATTNVTVTAADAVGVDGEMSMYKVEATATASTQFMRALTATASTQYYVIRAKKGSGATDANQFAVYNNTTAADLSIVSIDYDTGVLTHAVGSGATAEPVGHGGIWEIRIPCTSGITAGNSLTIYAGFVGGIQTAGEFAHVGFPDLADKPNLTHIPTAGSNVTTVGGGLVMDLSVHDEIVNPGGFTVVIAVDGTNLVGVTGDKMLVSGGVDGDNQIYIQAYNGNWRVVVFVGASPVIVATLGAVAAGRTVLAASFQVGACLGVMQGGSMVSLGTLAEIPAIPELCVGVYAQSPIYQPGAPTELVVAYPRACTAGELRALVNNF